MMIVKIMHFDVMFSDVSGVLYVGFKRAMQKLALQNPEMYGLGHLGDNLTRLF